MTERRFLPAPFLEGYAVYQIPHGKDLIIRCQSCGVDKDIAREYLTSISSMASLKELSPRFRCTICGAKNARIMVGNWA